MFPAHQSKISPGFFLTQLFPDETVYKAKVATFESLNFYKTQRKNDASNNAKI
jgi:hypothetical protein